VEPGVVELRGARLGQFILVATIIMAATFGGVTRSGLLLLLIVDLATKSLGKFAYAPLALVARTLLRITRGVASTQKRVNSGPKRFAARVGLTFALGLVLCEALHWWQAFYVIAAAFGSAALLDATSGICVACVLYSRWNAWSLRTASSASTETLLH
jgi:hypothetical protein